MLSVAETIVKLTFINGMQRLAQYKFYCTSLCMNTQYNLYCASLCMNPKQRQPLSTASYLYSRAV